MPGRTNSIFAPIAKLGDAVSAVQFYFDFGSPNAYLSHKILPEIERRTGVKLDYVPILLGGIFKATNNRSPMEAFANIKNKYEYERLESLRREARPPPFSDEPILSRQHAALMRGAVAAKMDGDFARYVDAVFHHMWEEPKKMDDPAMIRAALDASGLDGGKLLERAQDPKVKEQLVRNTEASVARGSFGAPTFFVGDEIFFGKDRLRDVEAEIVAKSGKAKA
jgi:2-hydroxychromene-2-carboxylate isomerase